MYHSASAMRESTRAFPEIEQIQDRVEISRQARRKHWKEKLWQWVLGQRS